VSGFFVALAAEGDVGELAALMADAHAHPWTPAQILSELRAEGAGGVLVARFHRSDGGVAACGSCCFRILADEVEILDVAVARTFRRRGVGRFLVRLALQRAARAGARVAWLEVRAGNGPARALYAGLGFEVYGVRRAYYSQPVEDALLMRLSLSGTE
jgi:ribosomal-protein-alanine N-acetyltransferase